MSSVLIYCIKNIYNIHRKKTHTHTLPCWFLWTTPHSAPWSPPDGHTSCQRRLETSRRLDTAEDQSGHISDVHSTSTAPSEGSVSYLLHNTSLVLKNPGVVLMNILLLPVLHTHTHKHTASAIGLSLCKCMCARVRACMSDHRIVKDLPHVWVRSGCVEVAGGQQTAELVPVGHKHEDALRT